MLVEGLIDYLRVTIPRAAMSDVIAILPESFDAEIFDYGRYSYTKRIGASETMCIYYGDREDCSLQLSGQGLSAWREHGTSDIGILRHLRSHDAKCTRLDYALDLYSDLAAIGELILANKQGRLKTRSKAYQVVEAQGYEGAGKTLYLGSPKSDRRVRVYDKAAQLKLLGEFITRIEITTKGDYAKVGMTASTLDGPDKPMRAMLRDFVSDWGVEWANDATAVNGDSEPPRLGRKAGNPDGFALRTVAPFLRNNWADLSQEAKDAILIAVSRTASRLEKR